jgi:YjbR
VAETADVPLEIVARLREICLGLPDAYEEEAWVGARWRVRKRTFAHVLMVEEGYPPAYARAVGGHGPFCVVTFRSAEADVLSEVHHRFFRARWGADVAGLVIDDDVDWAEVAELLTDSYCILAPKKLAAQVGRLG